MTSRGCPLHSTNLLFPIATNNLQTVDLLSALAACSTPGPQPNGWVTHAHLSWLLTQPLPCHAEALAQPLL